jgi:diguanylate cyclase
MYGLLAELESLRADLHLVRGELDLQPLQQLLDVNERLVVAALRADGIAEQAALRLESFTRDGHTDGLTGVPTRDVMLERMKIAISLARRHGKHLAVLFIDLDNLKLINDRLGHAVGDAALKEVTRRLAEVIRDSDTISRHGGDEFLVLLAEIASPADAGLIAAKMLLALALPFSSGGHVVELSASFGISVYPQDGEDAETLVERADAAMYRSKKVNPGGYQYSETGSSAAPLLSRVMTAKEQPVQALESCGRQMRLLAMVAHELRNPLAPISVAAGLLEGARADAVRFEELRQVILRQVGHMSRLIDDLLQAGQSAASTFRMRCELIDLSVPLAAAIDSCAPAFRSRGQRFVSHIPTRRLPLSGDCERLTQVFTNLLSNASKYTQKGGEVSLSVTELGGEMRVAITDNGMGMEAGVLPTIFDMFFQGPQTVEEAPRGAGVGLAVVRELVAAHQGSVVGTSAGVGLGSKFVVALPLAR